MKSMFLAMVIAVLAAGSARAADAALLEQALAAAQATFARAMPQLEPLPLGVDTIAYGAALRGRAFQSAQWDGPVALVTEIRRAATGSCSRFAAFVVTPPENGAIRLVLCPQFFTPGRDDLRELTLLHELVHVVAGPDECRAMGFAALVEQAARGSFTPVDVYWQANDCPASAFALPD